jgi:metal-responsive CopG/Arc/MetJ family transcriptional regulator
MRDAALHFAEYNQRGELMDMADEEILEGHLVIYYQHGIERKLLDLRHSNELEVSSYNHSCLKHSHTCVDLLQAIGSAASFRKIMAQLNDTASVDKVSFISAPMREDGCC